MSKGISIFLGMDQTIEDNMKYISRAKKYGFSIIFTSLQIPEVNYKKLIDDFKLIVKYANNLEMKVIADISPMTFNYLNINKNDITSLKQLGLYAIRADFGFSPKKIAEFTNNHSDIKLELNASTLTRSFLEELSKYNPNYNIIQACYNYYPRLNTGIYEEKLLENNSLLKKYNIKISAFISSLKGKRGPLYEGLPTLEKHRFLDPYISAKHLFVLGIDRVLFGDSVADDNELKSVGSIHEKYLELNIKLFNCSNIEKNFFTKSYYKTRLDLPQEVIRIERKSISESILPFNNIERKLGDITLDNDKYLRYKGEIQICLCDLPKDDRVNVVGRVNHKELFLLNYIKEGSRFKFIVK